MTLADLVALARSLSLPDRDLCILAEGNVSGRADGDSFWIKGSGQQMAEIESGGFSRVSLAAVLEAMDRSYGADQEIRDALNAANLEGPNPSTETFMHAVLLNQPGIDCVAHVHPTPLLSLLCLPGAEGRALRRLFPDEIVCCGPASCYVPYMAPGLALAHEVAARRSAFQQLFGVEPKTYWLQNHGLIAVGATTREVEAACLMSVKAARVLLGALQTGIEPTWLSEREVDQIYNWPDEHARQRALWGS